MVTHAAYTWLALALVGMLALPVHSVTTQPPLPLDAIANFRPVSPTTLPGIYRAAGLEKATAADVAEVLDGARIRTIIDLRNQDEIDKAAKTETDFGRALLDLFDGQAAVGAGEPASEGSGNLRRFHVPILEDADAFLEEVAERLPPARKAQAAFFKGFDGKRYDRLLYDEIARNRQLGLYTVMCKTGAPLIGTALQRIAERRGSGAVLFHCAQGKDRTGVLAALLQHTAGEPEESLVAEYAASEENIKEFEARTGEERDSIDKNGVDWSALKGSPPEAMTGTLAWLREEHGSIDGFLQSALAAEGGLEPWRRQLLDTVRRPA